MLRIIIELKISTTISCVPTLTLIHYNYWDIYILLFETEWYNFKTLNEYSGDEVRCNNGGRKKMGYSGEVR